MEWIKSIHPIAQSYTLLLGHIVVPVKEERIQDPAAVQGDGPGGQTENYRQTLFSDSTK